MRMTFKTEILCDVFVKSFLDNNKGGREKKFSGFVELWKAKKQQLQYACRANVQF